MKKFYLPSLLFVLLFQTQISSQTKDYELGSSQLLNRYTQQSGFFDFSDPESVNIKVSIWGFVRYPGRYTIPVYSSIIDLISYAGGPTDAAHLDDMRIYRVDADSVQTLIKVDYNDIMYEAKLDKRYKRLAELEAGDILVIPGSPRLYTRDQVTIWVSILSALISLSILILNIARN